MASSRRGLLRGLAAGGLVAGAGLSLGAGPATAASRRTARQNPSWTPPSTPALAEQELFVHGNARWKLQAQLHPREYDDTRTPLVAAQHPWAMIVGCIDSRVPPELIFDQGLGDLFVSRTAGQVLDGAVLGSTAYAATKSYVKLIVVLGHQSCGAVQSAIERKDNPGTPNFPPRLEFLTDRIKDAIPPAGTPNRENLAINENIRRIRNQLLQEPEISPRVAAGTLNVIGARYELDTWIAHKIV
ncbi:carbonic anhydrase [Streptomyces tsukubensis]|uniref:carbonic anhydrase n=1 Tax=Streptomyces tsukubensis TaxID=83656 RepID=UPI00368AEEC0